MQLVQPAHPDPPRHVLHGQRTQGRRLVRPSRLLRPPGVRRGRLQQGQGGRPGLVGEQLAGCTAWVGEI